MKIQKFWKGLLYLLIINITSCSISQEKQNQDLDLQTLCNDPEFIVQLSENIPATIKIVEEGQPFFNGNKKFYLVDVETYIPEIFEKYNQKYQKIFPISDINAEVGETVNLTGEIFSCVTGLHGLSTNDLKGFMILKK